MSKHGLAQEAISGMNKGLGLLERAAAPEEWARLSWNLLREDLSLPSAVLYADKIRHNLDWMQRFIAAYGVKLAPHGKTTMAPRLFQMQIDSGAWGITLATAQQTWAAATHGIRRVLMANELVGKENMQVIARLLEDPGFEFYCLVDSADLVRHLGVFFRARGMRLRVLLELGADGGRAGVRDDAQMRGVLEALAEWNDAVALCGVELYEGVLGAESEIRAFLRRAVAVMRRLAAEQRFERTPAILSGAGSAWYDVVAEEFTAARLGEAVDIVLRPGCYLTHDIGAYREAQARILASNPIAQGMQEGLVPALHIWAYVLSLPETGKAIVGMGKRDAAFDSGLPVPALWHRPGDAAPRTAPANWKVTRMMDQHAYLEIPASGALRVGDMIGFDIAHPCLTFDKWRVLPIVDVDYTVIDAVETYF